MTKLEAIELFGGISKMARALEISRQAIYKMPDELTTAHTDRIIGACRRLNMEHPTLEHISMTQNT